VSVHGEIDFPIFYIIFVASVTRPVWLLGLGVAETSFVFIVLLEFVGDFLHFLGVALQFVYQVLLLNFPLGFALGLGKGVDFTHRTAAAGVADWTRWCWFRRVGSHQTVLGAEAEVLEDVATLGSEVRRTLNGRGKIVKSFEAVPHREVLWDIKRVDLSLFLQLALEPELQVRRRPPAIALCILFSHSRLPTSSFLCCTRYLLGLLLPRAVLEIHILMRDDTAWALVAPGFALGPNYGLALSLLGLNRVLFFDVLELCLGAQRFLIGWLLLLVDGNAWDFLGAVNVAGEARRVVASAWAIGIHSVGWS
jgi:hypothetical protein